MNLGSSECKVDDLVLTHGFSPGLCQLQDPFSNKIAQGKIKKMKQVAKATDNQQEKAVQNVP